MLTNKKTIMMLEDQLACAESRKKRALHMASLQQCVLPEQEDETKYYLGQHMLVDFKTPVLHLSAAQFETIIRDAAIAANATILTSKFFDCSPKGIVSGIVVIEESHFSMHYLPSNGVIALDVYTCGNKIKFNAAVEHIKQAIQAVPYEEVDFKRGIRKVLNDQFVAGDFVPGIAVLDESTLHFIQDAETGMMKANKQAPLGQHYIAEFYLCNPEKINDAEFVLNAFLQSLNIDQSDKHFGFVHQFVPQGVSAVVIGDGFHLTVHDWPEYAYAAIDLCVFNDIEKHIDPQEVIQFLVKQFQSQKITVNSFPRGRVLM